VLSELEELKAKKQLLSEDERELLTTLTFVAQETPNIKNGDHVGLDELHELLVALLLALTKVLSKAKAEKNLSYETAAQEFTA